MSGTGHDPGGPRSFRGHDVVRPYVMTGGRTRTARRDLRVETMLATVPDADPRGLTAEQAALLECCRTPMALAEASAHLGLVTSVTAILAGDLVAEGLLDIHQTDPVEIELDMLNRMIEAVRTR